MGFTITGRVILLECKISKGPSLELGPRGLKAHQRIALNEAHRAGGLGLVAWMNENRLGQKRIAVIDAGQVKTYSAGRKSVPWRDIPRRFIHRLDDEPENFLWPFLSNQLA
jgi:hypothetical protein